MKVAREETFGPLAPLFRFGSDEEGIQMANDTEFGLASYFFSRDIGRACEPPKPWNAEWLASIRD